RRHGLFGRSASLRRTLRVPTGTTRSVERRRSDAERRNEVDERPPLTPPASPQADRVADLLAEDAQQRLAAGAHLDPARHAEPDRRRPLAAAEIGRASCRERVSVSA